MTDTASCNNCFSPNNKCDVGQYFSAPCSCSFCRVQPIHCVDNATYPKYAGCSGYGVQDNSACVSSEFDCGLACVEGIEYQVTACDPGSTTVRNCQQCTSVEGRNLGVDNYIRQPCTIFSDVQVEKCTPPKECSAGEYWSGCTAYRDGMCIPCTSTICERGMYLSSCSSNSDTECLPCNASVRCTEPGTYRSECVLSDNHECRTCSTCVLGSTYETQACTPVTNRECAECTYLGSCPADMYKKSKCTLLSNTECHPCSK